MITITDISQRIFFAPSVPIEIDPCSVWLLKYGAWSDCGMWNDLEEWQDDVVEGKVLQAVLLTGANTVKKSGQVGTVKNGRVYRIDLNFFENVPDDDYVLNLSNNGALVYTTRLKIKRQTVTRKSNTQAVTRKVNRIAI